MYTSSTEGGENWNNNNKMFISDLSKEFQILVFCK